jgi:Ca2+-binding RTX toxin-like protein
MISFKNRLASSIRTNVVVGMVLALAAGNIASSAVSAAPKVPLCFGKKATIVGTNRDPIRSVKLVGTARSDVIVGLGGSDRIEGRGGDDLICAGGGENYVLAGDGDDKVRGQANFDTLIGGKGHDRMWGGGGTDALLGGRGHDRLFGGPGHEDSLIGGAGNDLLDGGRGYDLAEFWDSPGGIEADLTTGTATGYGDDELISIEGLIGSNGDDALTGSDLSNNLQGGAGNDVIRALGSAADGGMDILRSAGGENILDGGDGPDIASYNLNPWPVTADLAAGTTTTPGFGSDTLIGIEHLTGSKNNDTLIGDDGDNVIIGNGGDDTMDGRGGMDEVSFIESREPVVADLSMGTADAGEWGTDTFVNFENLSGSVWRDVLTGDDGPNFIWGGDRADSILGLGGDDVLIGARGTDEANGGADSDACDAETEVDCELDPPHCRTWKVTNYLTASPKETRRPVWSGASLSYATFRAAHATTSTASIRTGRASPSSLRRVKRGRRRGLPTVPASPMTTGPTAMVKSTSWTPMDPMSCSSQTTRSRMPHPRGRRMVNGSHSLEATTIFPTRTSSTSTRCERTGVRSPR